MSNSIWTLRDAMRLAHPKGVDRAVGEFILRDKVVEDAPAIIQGFAAMQRATTKQEVLAVLEAHKNLPWETIPTQFHKELDVWKALFNNGSLRGQALLRNITRFARLGAFKNTKFAAEYAEALTDESMIAATRLHPIQFLNALIVHKNGQTKRVMTRWGYEPPTVAKDWDSSQVILDALEDGFYKAFKYVEPTGLSYFIGLDVSSSMGSKASGSELSCAQMGAALAMTIARTERAYEIRGFTVQEAYGWRRRATQLTDLGITARTRLDDAFRKVQKSNFGATDCALPMVYAMQEGLDVDTFIVITDNETWAGGIKPFQALKEYRRKMNKPEAKLIVVALSGTEFSIADPNDPGMLDIVGGDSNLPRIVTDFSAGRV